MSGPVASRQETIEWFLTTSKRKGNVPVHKVFVQRSGASPGPGPLARFVSAGRERALDLYLLLLLRSAGHPHKVALPAGTWARALGVATPDTASAALAKQWRWLADHRLIERGRRGSWAEVRVLHEDGSGEDYRKAQAGGPWLSVPFAYWHDNWIGRLGLPAKAMLLIALSLLDDYYLPEEKGPSWYGISPDTVGRGLRSLKEHGLLSERILQKKAPGTARGFTRQHYYTLQPPFGPHGKTSRAAKGGEVVP